MSVPHPTHTDRAVFMMVFCGKVRNGKVEIAISRFNFHHVEQSGRDGIMYLFRWAGALKTQYFNEG
jgi:hypothetical protein